VIYLLYICTVKLIKNTNMKLIYLDLELDPSKEHKLYSKNLFGFKVTVKYKRITSYTNKHKMEHVVNIFNNCTEVHHMYKTLSDKRDKIAFESDIHNTGCSQLINDIKSVIIEEATEKEKEF
jgi:hypothetical protein